MSSSADHEIISLLIAALGPERVLTDPDALDLRAWDALSASRVHPAHPILHCQPVCVCFPETTSEVQSIVVAANQRRVPVVPYGGGSGLMGGAISVRHGIVVDMRRMNRIVEVDVASRMTCAEAGVVLEALQRVLSEQGLTLGHDPWTLPVATVGGTVSTNSLGYAGGKYGSMGDQVLGVEAVLPNGELCRTRGVVKTSTGIDLKHLFVGGEGCFGILIRVALEVFPTPEVRSLLGFRCPSFEDGFAVIQGLFAQGLSPSLMDYADSTPDPAGPARLYLGFEGSPEIVAAEVRVAGRLCRAHQCIELAHAEVEHFWKERHAAALRFMHDRKGRRAAAPDGWHRDWVHVALPAARVLEFRHRALEIITRRGVEFRASGLWTRPELFSFAMAKQGGAEALKILEETVFMLLDAVHQCGGSMEYCHGVGAKLAPLMRKEHGPNLDLMRSLKDCLDPNRIMNPGKLALS